MKFRCLCHLYVLHDALLQPDKWKKKYQFDPTQPTKSIIDLMQNLRPGLIKKRTIEELAYIFDIPNSHAASIFLFDEPKTPEQITDKMLRYMRANSLPLEPSEWVLKKSADMKEKKRLKTQHKNVTCIPPHTLVSPKQANKTKGQTGDNHDR